MNKLTKEDAQNRQILIAGTKILFEKAKNISMTKIEQ
jgi:hypothetical protein